MVAVTEESLIAVGALEALKDNGVVVVHGAGRPIAVYYHDGQILAVDNRCPHMGFPLHKGTVKDGILTCHWHQARFDLCSGCTFDLFADDVPAFNTLVRDGQVFVDPKPRQTPNKSYHLARLGKGLEQNISLIQAKSLTSLLNSGTDLGDIVRQVAQFGSRNHDSWADGMTILSIVANLHPHLSAETAYYALCRGVQQVAANCAGATPRRLREPLDTDAHAIRTLHRWMRQWVKARHRDGAERVLLTALKNDANTQDLANLVFTAVSDRMFANIGHPFDFCNKVFELLDLVGHEHAADLFALVTAGMAGSRGQEEAAHWYHPVDVVRPLRQVEDDLPDLMRQGEAKTWPDDGSLTDILLGDDALQIIDTLRDALAVGAPPTELAKRVAYCAAMRLARFAMSNDVRDWFGPQHTFTYCNAVHQALKRSASPTVVRAIFHGAMAVYMDRFLNVPAARLPGERKSLEDLPTDPDELRRNFLHSLDQRSEVDAAARIVARYLRLGHPIQPLIDTLTFATVREDLDFHPLQVLEAGVRQYFEWEGAPQAEHILIGVARNLAAHCPTRRAGLQTATIALRLQRGDKIYEDD